MTTRGDRLNSIAALSLSAEPARAIGNTAIVVLARRSSSVAPTAPRWTARVPISTPDGPARLETSMLSPTVSAACTSAIPGSVSMTSLVTAVPMVELPAGSENSRPASGPDSTRSTATERPRRARATVGCAAAKLTVQPERIPESSRLRRGSSTRPRAFASEALCSSFNVGFVVGVPRRSGSPTTSAAARSATDAVASAVTASCACCRRHGAR